MAEPWKSPANVIAIIGLIISLIGNAYQYNSTDKKIEFEKEKANREFDLERQRWEVEREKWEEEKRKWQLVEADREKLEVELEDVKAAIKVWDDALFQDNLKLMMMKNNLRTMTDSFKIDTQKKNIQANEDAIEAKKMERERVIKRQKEIEALLRNN